MAGRRRNPARLATELPPGVQVGVVQWGWGDGQENLRVSYEGNEGALSGQIRAIRGLEGQTCGDAWVVGWVKTDPGWGPLLYDVLLERAGDDGVAPSRVSITPEARAVWRYYFEKRPDVEARRLPRSCSPAWPDDPHLDRVYVKRDTSTTDRLAAAGLLVC